MSTYKENRNNQFKKWLIDEMKRTSNLGYKEIIYAVNGFENTQEYQDSFNKWDAKTKRKPINNQVKHILSDIL